MQGYARMLVIGGIVAVMALAAVAFAVAETGPGADSAARDDSSVQATDAATPTATATEAPVAGTPEDDGADDAGTTTALNPAGHCVALPDTSDVIQHPDKHTNWTIADCEPADDDGEHADDEQDDGADAAGTTTALNPAGHCVELPDTSDVIQHPEKHDNWTIADCEPSSDSGSPDGDDDDDAPDADEPDGEGAEKVPATNPGGVCTEVSANSDVVLHPEKHPGWTLGVCEEAGD